MWNRTELLKIISGRRNDFVAIALRFGLGLLTPFYRAAVWWRNKRYDSSQKMVRRVAVPVISVGNLTTGGTGKTPMVVWLCNLLRSCNQRVALVSRGYARDNTGAGRNDEALELELRLPEVPHLQDPDRYKIAQTAVKDLDAEIIVLDDGFQHRKLARDLDIVLIDGTQPFGFGRLLPRGLLREPISSLKRAGVVVLTRADAIDNATKQDILQRVRSVNPSALWVESKTSANQFLQADGTVFPLHHLRDKQILAFCGIGNPIGFTHMLDQIKLSVVSQQDFPDHHGYTAQELTKLGEVAAKRKVDAIICTHKDLVKVGANQLGGVPVYALVIDVEFLDGEARLAEIVKLLI